MTLGGSFEDRLSNMQERKLAAPHIFKSTLFQKDDSRTHCLIDI